MGNFNIVVKYGACALLSGDCDNFVSTDICKSEDQEHQHKIIQTHWIKIDVQLEAFEKVCDNY